MVHQNGRFYIVSTEVVERRLRQHNSGRQAATRYRIPLELVYVESYADRTSAVRRERELKRQESRRIIEQLIREPKGELSEIR
jgi:putative endonuclease